MKEWKAKHRQAEKSMKQQHCLCRTSHTIETPTRCCKFSGQRPALFTQGLNGTLHGHIGGKCSLYLSPPSISYFLLSVILLFYFLCSFPPVCFFFFFFLLLLTSIFPPFSATFLCFFVSFLFVYLFVSLFLSFCLVFQHS